MAKIGSLTADLKLESAAFIRDMRKAAQETARSTNAMQRSMATLNKSFAGAASSLKGMVAGFVGLQGIRAVANLAKQSLDLADSLTNQSRAIGVSVEALQQYRFAATQSGISTEALDKNLGIFVKNLGAARAGTGPLVSALKGFNDELLASLKNAESSEQALDLLFEAIANTTNAADKGRIAIAGFGRGGLLMTGLVADGAKSLEEMKQRAIDLGLVLSGPLAKAGDELGDRLALFGQAFQVGFATGFITELQDEFKITDDAVKQLSESAQAFGRLTAKAFKDALDSLKPFAKFITDLSLYITALPMTKGKGWEGLKIIAEGLDVGSLDTSQIERLNEFIQANAQQWIDASKASDEATSSFAKTKEGAAALAEGLDSGKVSAEDFAAALKAFQDADVVVTMNELTEAQKELRDVAQDAGQMMASSFADAIVEGKNFQDTINELTKDIAKMIIQLLIAKAIKMSIDAAFSAATGVPTTNFHAGGIVGKEGGGGRSLSAMAFVGAPRLHNGMMPGEFPAVLKKGEGVFTPEQMKALGAGSVQNNFTVINQAPNTKVTEERRENSTGGQDVTATIRQIMTKEVSDPASSVHRSMKATFGLSQAGVRR